MGTFINGQESKGPYGYLCLGLSYGWDEKERILALKRLILVQLDLKLRACVELPLYYDMFACENKIIEKDGKYYHRDCPILNLDMLEIPDKLNGVIEEEDFFGEKKKTFINPKGSPKYSVNRVCRRQSISFRDNYTELYACVTDFDKETLQGTLIGFDCLGKILLGGFGLKGLTRVQDIRQALLENMVLFDVKYEDDDKSDSRKNECGILNFDFSFDENGAPIFEYDPIW